MTVNGITKPTVIRTAYFNGTMTADNTSTANERQELLELAISLQGGSNSLAVFKDLEYFT
jgi:hypothetical protein